MRVLREILWPKGERVTGTFKMLHNENITVLESFPDISMVIKSYSRRWAGHVARMGEKRNV